MLKGDQLFGYCAHSLQDVFQLSVSGNGPGDVSVLSLGQSYGDGFVCDFAGPRVIGAIKGSSAVGFTMIASFDSRALAYGAKMSQLVL